MPKIPAPVDVGLDAKDGWKLAGTYYEGTKGKAAVPFIMVHGWEGRRGEYDYLARSLQQLGHTCLTVDLRGHGGSIRYRTITGEEKEILPEDLSRADIERMVNDVEAAKDFLMKENNAGKCNIEQLCVIGSEVGALTVMNWACLDWPLRGRVLGTRANEPKFNVKALVLLSPVQTFKGVTAQSVALKHPAILQGLSILILAGSQESSKAFGDAKRIYSALERARTKSSRSGEDSANVDLFFPVDGNGLPTSLQGTKLLQAPRELRIYDYVTYFVKVRLTDRAADLPWEERSAG
ncbi:MAG: alpha/beta fold hydrolase [Pirellulaceae bacterium]|nr:alpha/beta fold hydrolase [Pirellulaceae bacterium]